MSHRETDVFIRAARAISRGRHAQYGTGFFIEAAAGAETGIEHRLGHRAPHCKPVADAGCPMSLGIVLGRQTGHAFEQAMEMACAQISCLRESLQ